MSGAVSLHMINTLGCGWVCMLHVCVCVWGGGGYAERTGFSVSVEQGRMHAHGRHSGCQRRKVELCKSTPAHLATKCSSSGAGRMWGYRITVCMV